jgi:hypothetical protein
MEPAIYTTLAVTALNLLATIFQSMKENHFSSDCCFGCLSISDIYSAHEVTNEQNTTRVSVEHKRDTIK